MKTLFVLFFGLVGHTTYAQNVDSDSSVAQFSTYTTDSLAYSKADYEEMITAYSSEEFSNILDRYIQGGDTNAVKVRHIISLPYGQRHEAITEEELSLMVYSFKKSQEILARFEWLSEELKATADAQEAKNDSTIQKIKSALDER